MAVPAMNSSEVSDYVKREIGSDWERSNAHGVNLRACLVQPQRRRFRDSFSECQMLDLWVVLEETPQTHLGYEIVFDEDNGTFGLATFDKMGDEVFLGYYGTFIETLDAM
jgi:dihydropteroate synthase